MSVSIIDYGMGNLRSVQKGFEKAGCNATIIRAAHEVEDARALVLPGVGAFRNCLQNLDSQKLITPILKFIESGRPFMGICLGLQILFSESEEFGKTPGLDIIRGTVIRFPSISGEDTPGLKGPNLKIPHMGWNTVHIAKAAPVLDGIADGSFFYFVHSYYVVPQSAEAVATTTAYGVEFVSSVCKDNIFACQFHPEKSQSVGLKLLKNFSEISARETKYF